MSAYCGPITTELTVLLEIRTINPAERASNRDTSSENSGFSHSL